ncbi:hypothetical protein PAEPH01_1222 [Pancytospora epiphaga]|nr:hypothetical protein PAEPH01_1222 [Pancytospora epiphaga]
MNGYTNVFYEGNDAERLVEEHNRWFETTSQGNLRTLITNKHFTNRHRIYSTVAYFQENWEQEFNCKNTKKGNFTLEHGEVVERLYMNAYTRNFRCDTFKIGNVEYEIVAVPYAEKNKFSESFRYMIYIIPRGKSTISLSRAWAYFNSRTNNDIRGYISKMKVETINLQIPKIEVLKSVIDFRTVLPRHYSEIKVKTSAVAMETELGVFIKITEEGETATAHEPTVKTYCARKSFKADVPHIAFVYDIFLNRILFVIKDVGPQK